eukprot:comp19184_c0_seq1/m.21889 comp19184_c0_seq1/g.21889  ORF comp19184_c0_seq1/g.21889 comp19184_c0_seq1/m.21889 type:complete len:621 (-) comp19184_c0_seq1:329-2191(-)
MTALRDKQKEALRTMLNLNAPAKKGNTEPVWKILVYDRMGQDIISPILTVTELRELGVTLHLQLHSDRDAISDTPAVYFVMPTKENVERICRDIKSELYESYYINFITAVPRSLLEDLATAALEADAVAHVSKVCDQYSNFVSLEDDLFVCRLTNRDSISFYALNNPRARDVDIENCVDEIVDSLFSMLVTAGSVPVIRCPRNNAADMVSKRLDQKLRDHLKNTRTNLFTEGNSSTLSFQRPVLIILDRTVDLPTLLHHTWTYQALVHDLLDMKSNRVSVQQKAEEGRPGKLRTYDIDSTRDQFWQKHRGSPFPVIPSEVELELNKYKEETAHVSALSDALGMDPNAISENIDLSENARKLTSAVSNLPQLTEKKRFLDMHTVIAWALFDQIKARGLDTFFEVEEKCMSRQYLEKPIATYLREEKGTPMDKLRLYLIYFLTTENITEAITQECEGLLQGMGVDLTCMNYLRRLKTISKMAEFRDDKQSGAAGSSLMSRMTNKMFEHGSDLIKGVKNLLPNSSKLPTTRIVDALMEQRSSPDVDDFSYYDPKWLRAQDNMARIKTPFTEAYVFVVGGGNYVEYLNLRDYVQKQPYPKSITYGTTELLTPDNFMRQLQELGR